MTTHPQIQWQEGGLPRSARWRSENGSLPPRRVVLSDDTLNADTAYRYACEGTAMLWRGDFHNARQLLQALARRIDRRIDQPRSRAAKAGAAPVAQPVTAALAFHQHRQAQAQRAKVLGMVLIGLDADYGIPLRRAPDLRLACTEAWGEADLTPLTDDGLPSTEPAQGSVASLRELMGLVGAHEWRKKGVEVPALARPGQTPDEQRIHPHYGIFSPVRGEYVDLVAQAPLPAGVQRAFDIGVGTGVLSAVLARRGVPQVLATDQDPRALTCARDNLQRLGLNAQVSVIQADLFPPLAEHGPAELIVCNPPWVPAKANSPVEHAVYDPGSRMLKGFLQGLAAHLAPGGEGWLILSDLAEHLELRPRAELLAWIEAAGLVVLGRLDVRPRHSKVADAADPLHAARAAEITSLWRLGVQP